MPEQASVILERRKTKDLSRLALARFANLAQRAAGVTGDVNILLTTNPEMQRLNRQFRGKDKPTDVLSFPHAVGADHGGDIAISLQTARAQAAGQGHNLLTEVKVLILHGMLHLAGHDHERDRGQMSRLEQRLRAELHLPSGLIERSGGTKPKASTPARQKRARRGPLARHSPTPGKRRL